MEIVRSPMLITCIIVFSPVHTRIRKPDNLTYLGLHRLNILSSHLKHQHPLFGEIVHATGGQRTISIPLKYNSEETVAKLKDKLYPEKGVCRLSCIIIFNISVSHVIIT